MSSTAERLAYAPTAVMPERAVQAATGNIAAGVITDLSALESLGAEWQALERASGCSHQFFQTFAWCMHWARAAARVAGDRRQLCVITVRDNGRGFDVDSNERISGRYGLVTMRERAHGVGGTISIESQPGTGTLITAEVPLGVLEMRGSS